MRRAAVRWDTAGPSSGGAPPAVNGLRADHAQPHGVGAGSAPTARTALHHAGGGAGELLGPDGGRPEADGWATLGHASRPGPSSGPDAWSPAAEMAAAAARRDTGAATKRPVFQVPVPTAPGAPVQQPPPRASPSGGNSSALREQVMEARRKAEVCLAVSARVL